MPKKIVKKPDRAPRKPALFQLGAIQLLDPAYKGTRLIADGRGQWIIWPKHGGKPK